MRFTHNGQEYLLEFQRQYKHVSHFDRDGNSMLIKTQYPYTTVRILTLPNRKVFRTATVGCWYKERFRPKESLLNKGRERALRAIILYDNSTRADQRLPAEFRKAMWDAYHNRRNNGTTTPAKA